jgi:hypothetical protein
MVAPTVRRWWIQLSACTISDVCQYLPLRRVLWRRGDTSARLTGNPAAVSWFRVCSRHWEDSTAVLLPERRVDLCQRVWEAGYKVLFTPQAEITHLGGQSVKRARTRFDLETHGAATSTSTNTTVRGAVKIRSAILFSWCDNGLWHGWFSLSASDTNKAIAESLAVQIRWNYRLDPVRFVRCREA